MAVLTDITRQNEAPTLFKININPGKAICHEFGTDVCISQQVSVVIGGLMPTVFL